MGAWSRFDFFFRAFTAHLSRSVAWWYPVTPLAAFGLSGAFDKWDAINAINAPNLESACSGVPPLPEHAGMKPSGWQVDGRGLVHVWSTPHRNRTVVSDL
jgi:hypothetical protein